MSAWLLLISWKVSFEFLAQRSRALLNSNRTPPVSRPLGCSDLRLQQKKYPLVRNINWSIKSTARGTYGGHKQETFAHCSLRRFPINAEQTPLIDRTRSGSQVFALFYQLPTCERYVKTKEMRRTRDILRLSTLKFDHIIVPYFALINLNLCCCIMCTMIATYVF